jgi:hypothetical protein
MVYWRDGEICLRHLSVSGHIFTPSAFAGSRAGYGILPASRLPALRRSVGLAANLTPPCASALASLGAGQGFLGSLSLAKKT